MKAKVVFLLLVGFALANPLASMEDRVSVEDKHQDGVLSNERVSKHGNKTHPHYHHEGHNHQHHHASPRPHSHSHSHAHHKDEGKGKGKHKHGHWHAKVR